MKICVTGSSGQIGSYVVDVAREQGHDVVGLDLRPSEWTTHVGDIRRAEDVRAALNGCEAVVHCAAHISVQGSIDNPLNDLDHNIAGTVQLLEESRKAEVKRFLLTSSAAVYGTPVMTPISEEHPTVPLSPYGVSKLACEHYARIYSELHGMSVVIVRPFNVYSARQDPSNPYSGVLSKFAQRVKAGLPPIILGDGSQTRDFVHASDVGQWMVRLVTASERSPLLILNLATGLETSVLECAKAFLQAERLQTNPEFRPPRTGEIARSVADTGCAQRLSLVVTVPLNVGIRELLQGGR